ncbi:putative reverse transcriptase domain-containing protein [Tanacetum coccineum]
MIEEKEEEAAFNIFLSQKKYAIKVLERANTLTCNPCQTPIDTESKLAADGDPVSDSTLYHSLAGALQYLKFTRPDISYDVQHVTLSRSSVKAEYRGVANAVAETCWLRNLLRELHTPLSSANLLRNLLRDNIVMSHPFSPDHATDILEVEPVQPELVPAAPEPAPPSPDHLEAEEIEEEEQEEMDLDDEIDEAKVRPSVCRFSGSIHVRGGLSSTAPIADDSKDLTLGDMRMDIYFLCRKGLDEDLRNEIQHGNMVEHRVTTLEDQVQIEAIRDEGPSEAIDVAKDIAVDHATRGDTGGPVGGAGGSVEAPAACECTFDGFMKYNIITFHGTKGEVELCRWFKKTEMVFSISECAEGKKVKFAIATLQGRVLTWWNSQVATLGLEIANRTSWTEIKKLMTEEFCPREELQRIEQDLWNLKVKDYNISSYTYHFNELALLYPTIVEPEHKKTEAYIQGLFENIKGDATSSKPANINEAFRMAHTLMEQ